MATQKDGGRPLPKFGDWDVNNPSSAEGFTVIFTKARNEKKTGGPAGRNVGSQQKYPTPSPRNYPDSPKKYPSKSKWFCCG